MFDSDANVREWGEGSENGGHRWEWPRVWGPRGGRWHDGVYQGGTSRVDENEVEVAEGSSVASGLTGGQTCGDVGEEENEWLLNECQAHPGVVEPVSGNTLSLNPQAEEFHPRPRIPMKYGPEVQSSIQLHALVKSSGLPNFKGCRVPVRTAINVAAVRDLTKGFHDQEAIDFLEFGFPISFQGMIHQTVPPGNHKGAREFPEAIEEYIRRECELGATLGPFDRNPLGESPIAVSPLNSVPKSETSERRIILDLSFPPGRGVNDGIERNMFLGEPYKLRLSGTDDMVDLIHRKGSGCLLFKRDLSRAFRQFAVDPADLDKLGFLRMARKAIPRPCPSHGPTDRWNCLSEGNSGAGGGHLGGGS